MHIFTQLLRRHWALLFFAVVIAVGVLTMVLVPPVRTQLRSFRDQALVWAGLKEEHTHESGTIYWCPMHPQIKRKKANEVCPICNMALVPLEGGAAEVPEELTLTARQVQQAGVVTRPVLRRRLAREIDTTGRIVSDERRQAKITSWVRGKSRIEKLHVDFTGAQVKKGDLMAELYSPDLIVAQDEFLMALDGPRRSSLDLAGSARQRLLDQGMTQQQVEELQRTKKVLQRIPIYAPLSGTVFERHVQEGEYINEGEMLFQISDLDAVWLFADIYEEELPLVKLGQAVKLSVRSFPGETFEGEVSFIDPMVQPESRTVRVRIEIPNEDRRLKPGMYARAQLRAELPETLAIAENAVLWSGQRQVALVKQGDGVFQPREIEIGQKWLYPDTASYRPGGQFDFGSERERYHEVLAGLAPGEQVVTAGAFLLSAESQFQSVLTKMLPPEDQSATLEEAVGEELAQEMRQLLEQYYELSQALAEDRLENVEVHFAGLSSAAESLSRQAEQDDMPDLAGAARAIAAEAQKASLQPPDDLKQARTRFGKISRSTVRLLAENGGQTLFGSEVFLFRCGMAKVGYENWLWWSEEKHNPYMGQEMLDCGSQLEVLKP